MSFLGKHRHNIDTKGRVSVPARFRSTILQKLGAVDIEEVSLMVLRSKTMDGSDVLSVYTEDALENDLEELRQSDMDADKLEVYEDLLFDNLYPVDLDKQGRIRLDQTLLEEVGIDKDVIIVGRKGHFDITDAATYERRMANLKENHSDLLRRPSKR